MEGESEPPKERKGKFTSDRDELLYEMVQNAWSNESSGDVNAPTGFFARISNSTDEISEVIEAFEDDHSDMARQHAKELVGHFLLFEYDDGSVAVDVYRDQPSLLADFETLQTQYIGWLAEERG